MVQQPHAYRIKPKHPVLVQRSKAVILGAKRALPTTPPLVTIEYVKSSPLPPSPPMDVLSNSDGEGIESIDDDEVDLELMNMIAKEDLTDGDGKLANGGPPRKRERLTHLTPEEKMWRRKLKNRIAAQTARDRKKARMDDIEGDLSSMRAVNRRLLKENQQLKRDNLAMQERMSAMEKTTNTMKVEADAFTPAATISAPQPREQASPLIHVLTALLLSHLPPSTASSTPSSPTSWPTIISQVQALPLPQRRRLQRAVLKWHAKEAKLGRMKPRATICVPHSA